MINKMRGMTYGFCAWPGVLQGKEAKKSLLKLVETGTDWIALAFQVYMDDAFSTNIYYDFERSTTDEDLICIINEAHKNGLKVCLKPIVDCKDGTWRAEINLTENEWHIWFKSFIAMNTHYAKIAERTECEMYCIGCEMISSESYCDLWNKVIITVKELYSGLLIYNANHGSETLYEWINELDYYGVSAYIPLSNRENDSLQAMVDSWNSYKIILKDIYKKFNKPIVFIEVGCRNEWGCSCHPWDYNVESGIETCDEEQAKFYESCFETFWKEPWFAGCFWWSWDAELYKKEDAKYDKSFNIYGKLAEDVVKRWYKCRDEQT